MRKLYLALLIVSLLALPAIAIADTFLADAPGFLGSDTGLPTEGAKEAAKTVISGRTILNENTEQMECWLQADANGTMRKYCTAIIHAAPLWVNDAGTWKNFTDWANVSLTAEGFNFTFGNDWVTIDPVVNYSNTVTSWSSLSPGIKNKLTKERPSKNLLSNWQYGFNLTIPQNYANNLMDFRFKVTSTSVPIVMDANGLIAGGNVLFSFADLEAKGFTWKVLDNTTIVVGNVTGKTSLDLDPTTGYFGRGVGEDTYMDSSNANTNYGTSTTLNIGQNLDIGNKYKTYLRFDISSLYPVTITSANVTVTQVTYGLTTVGVYDVNTTAASDSWIESTATWNNQPCGTGTTLGSAGINGTCNSTAEATSATTSGTAYTWPVTNMASGAVSRASKKFTICLWATAGGSYPTNSLRFNSKENGVSSAPYLNITYTQDLPPNATSFTQNATTLFSNQTLMLNATLADDLGLDYAWIETNESGEWINYTSTNLTRQWLTGWYYRKNLTIANATGAVANYPIRFVLNYGSGSDSGNTLYLNSHSQTDFDDVRFTDDNGTLLSYWISEYTDSGSATAWVKVVDVASTVNQSILIYYGNSTVGNASDSYATFPTLFSHFENSTGWTVATNTTGYMRIEDSQLKMNGSRYSSGSWLYQDIYTPALWANDQALMYKITNLVYFPASDKHLWKAGGNDLGNFYSYFYSYDDDISVKDYNLIATGDANFANGTEVWLGKQSGVLGNIIYYKDGVFNKSINGTGIHPAQTFTTMRVQFRYDHGAGSIAENDSMYIDWVAVRPFIYPEPYVSSSSDETPLQYFSSDSGRYYKFGPSTTSTTASLYWYNYSFSGTLYWRIGYNDTGGYSWGSNETELLPQYKLFNYGNNQTTGWKSLSGTSAGLDSPPPNSGPEYTGGTMLGTTLSQIAYTDDTRASAKGSTIGDDTYGTMRFDMNLSATNSYSRAYNATAMTDLAVTHEGYGGGTTYGMNLYMWNFTSASWYSLLLSKQSADQNNTNTTNYPYDFINASGSFYYIIENTYASTSGSGYVYTDWIQANVSYNQWYGSTATVNAGTLPSLPNVSIYSPINTTYSGNNIALGTVYFNVSTITNTADSCVVSFTNWATNYSMTQVNTSFYWLVNTTMNETSYTARFRCTSAGGDNQSEARNFSVDFPATAISEYDNTGGSIDYTTSPEMAVYTNDYYWTNWTMTLNTNKTGSYTAEVADGGSSSLPRWFNNTVSFSSYPGKTICWNYTMKTQTYNSSFTNTTNNHCFQVIGNTTFMLNILQKASTASTAAGVQASTHLEYNTSAQNQAYTNASAVGNAAYYGNSTVWVFNFTSNGNVNLEWNLSLNATTPTSGLFFCSKNSSWTQGTYTLSSTVPWTVNASIPPGASQTAFCWVNYTLAKTSDSKVVTIASNSTGVA